MDTSQALKSLALVRSQKVEESLALCDEVLATKPTDDAILTAMMHVLRGLGRSTHADVRSGDPVLTVHRQRHGCHVRGRVQAAAQQRGARLPDCLR